jgi:ribonuclease VapC
VSNSVLDASAILAYLSNEAGAEVVEGAINSGACLSAVNWAEALSVLAARGQRVDAVAKKLVESGLIGQAIQLMPFTSDDAVVVAQLRQTTKSIKLSLGDRSCLALAVRLKLPVVTADRTWKRLKVGVNIKCIR